jgi:hypothetical protein
MDQEADKGFIASCLILSRKELKEKVLRKPATMQV